MIQTDKSVARRANKLNRLTAKAREVLVATLNRSSVNQMIAGLADTTAKADRETDIGRAMYLRDVCSVIEAEIKECYPLVRYRCEDCGRIGREVHSGNCGCGA